MSETETDRTADGKLRCGLCWRDVFGTEHGRMWHLVFIDGSMRCWAPDVMGRYVDDLQLFDYISTFVVLATEDRKRLIATALDQQQQMEDQAESERDAMRLSHE